MSEDVKELIRRFESDIRSGCHSTWVEVGRSKACHSIIALKQDAHPTILEHLKKLLGSPVGEHEEALRGAWMVLLSSSLRRQSFMNHKIPKSLQGFVELFEREQSP